MDEFNQLAYSFNQMAKKLDKTEVMRKQLIGDVSHELRTPLSVIKGSMEGLIDGILPAEPKTFQQIYMEADRLERPVDDLQELSQVEAGAYSLDRKSVSIVDIAEDVCEHLQREFEAKEITLLRDLPDNPPELLTDEDRIRQVLLNLMGNALQYTLKGGQVRLSVKQFKDEIRVSVSDSGIGITEDQLEHIFTRFYRVDKSRSRLKGGSGIGLTIARHLVEAHGGRIWAESAGLGSGSTFTFTLPIT
jgi:histidine kinase